MTMFPVGLKTQDLVRTIAAAFLVVLASSVMPQKLGSEPTAFAQDQSPTSDSRRVLHPTTRPYSRGMPAATISNRPSLSAAELQSILKELDGLRITLEQALSPDLNYESIAGHASEVHCRARRLQGNLELTARQRQPEAKTDVDNRQVEDLIKAVCQTIQDLLSNPALRRSHVIDAELITEASKDLEAVIYDSKRLKQLAMSLHTKSSLTSITSNTRKAARKRSPNLQLTTDCWLFTPDFFLKRAAIVGNAPSQTVDGVKVFVKRHRLTQEQPVSLEECWIPNCSLVEYEDEHALIVKDFYSYEVAGKVFAYAAVYQIARVRNGKVGERLNQPVLLYFVDEEGQGVFELHQSALALNEVPGWILNAQR